MRQLPPRRGRDHTTQLPNPGTNLNGKRPLIYFAALNHNDLSLEKALRAAVFSHAPVRSPAEVDAVADELFARYADLDGSKLEAHRRRIERDTLIHGDSASARKQACKNRWTTDAELEYMMQVVRSQSQ